jgi:hypothetical protein
MTRLPSRSLVVVSAVAVIVIVVGALLTYGALNRPAAPGPLGSQTGSKVAAVPSAAAPTDADASAGDADAAGGDEDAAGGEEDDPNQEAQEQQEGVEARLRALESAGTGVGQSRPTADAPAAGWVGEQPFEATAPDDWEPAIAADPAAPWVYAVVTRYGTTKPCGGNCPSPYMALRISADGGVTWGASKPLCACKGKGQFDPIIEVVPGTGAVYALYMNGFNVMFIKSTNHGASFSAPVPVYGSVSWNDKPIIAVSDDGKDVYAAFNGPTGGDPWIAQSHDSGATWTQTKIVDSARYIFAFDGDVAADGTVYFAETSLLYGGGGNKGTYPSGAIEEHVFVSRTKGATWEDHNVTSVQPGVKCVSAGCPPDFYLAHAALSVDGSGNVVLLYDGATTTLGPQTVYARKSTDKGATWSAAVPLSKAGEEAVTPAVESRGGGDVRAFWYETVSGSTTRWNVWYRSSTDGGATWSTAVKISDATGGAAYKTATGFMEVYGDYGEIGITNTGKTIAIWGEGTSYDGPGGVWFNRQP